MMASVTSYEIVCATARRAPIKAYLELEAQPDQRIEYTVKLDRVSKKSTPRFRSAREKGIGSGVQIVIARSSARTGVIIKREGDEVEGRIGSLMKSFTPSATGWRRPNGPTMLGPFRACI